MPIKQHVIVNSARPSALQASQPVGDVMVPGEEHFPKWADPILPYAPGLVVLLVIALLVAAVRGPMDDWDDA